MSTQSLDDALVPPPHLTPGMKAAVLYWLHSHIHSHPQSVTPSVFHTAFRRWIPEYQDRQDILVDLQKDQLLAEVNGYLELTDAGLDHLGPLLEPI